MPVHSSDSTNQSHLLRQVTIELWHSGCWGLELNNEFKGLHIIEKSTYNAGDRIKADLVFIVKDSSEMNPLLEQGRAHENVYNLTVLKKTNNRARVLAEYNSDYSVIPAVTKSEMMAIEPFHIANGSKYWTFVAEEDAISKQIDQLKEKFQVRIKSIQDFSDPQTVEYADIVDKIYSTLSPRQREAIFLAAEKGYYQWPRDASAGEIADDMDVSGPTFLEHLRHGEHKMINRLLEQFEQRHRNQLLPTE